MRKSTLYSLLTPSSAKDLIAVYDALWRFHRRLDGPQGGKRRNRRLQIVRAFMDACSAAGLFRLMDRPQQFMRWVLRELYQGSVLTQERIGWELGYSQPYVSRMLNPADPGITLRPSQYRRWLAVFLRPDELALLD